MFDVNTLKKFTRKNDLEILIELTREYTYYSEKQKRTVYNDEQQFRDIIIAIQKEFISLLKNNKYKNILISLLSEYDQKLMSYFKTYFYIYIQNAVDHFYNKNVVLISNISNIFYNIIIRALHRNESRHPDRNHPKIDLYTFKLAISKEDLITNILYSCVSGMKSTILAHLRSLNGVSDQNKILIKTYFFIIKTMDELYLQLKDLINIAKVEVII